MTQKRTDRILDLLDASLQSTTPRQQGMPLGDLDLCCGCASRPVVEGRSWCERCLPDARDDAPPRPAGDHDEPASPWDELMQAALFHHNEIPDEAVGAVQIDAVIDGEVQALAFVAVDEGHNPVGLGLNVELIVSSPDCFAMLAALDQTFVRLFGAEAFGREGDDDE